MLDRPQERKQPSRVAESRRAEWYSLSQEERERRVNAVKGILAGGKRTVDDFLREKHAENDEEERRWEERHRAARKKARGDEAA